MYLDEKKIGEVKTDNFLSAKQLGIREAERTALIEVLGMLESGHFKHIPKDRFCEIEVSNRDKFYFNMGTWHSTCWATPYNYEMLDPDKFQPNNECGTMGCIGGWTEAVMGKKINIFSMEKLHDLFYPRTTPAGRWGNLSVDHAIKALRAKLTTGIADWT